MSGRSDEWVYGIRPVVEALKRARREVLEICIVTGGRNPRLLDLQEMAAGVPVRSLSARDLDKVTQGKRHQGVAARVAPFPWSNLEEVLRGGPVLMLEGIQDPQNLGAIIRSSVALGVDGVVMEKRRAAGVSPVVAKAACGALEHARLCRVTSLPRAIGEAKKAGYWAVGARVTEGSLLWDADFPDPVAVVVGGEGSGLRPVVGKGCDLWVSIPCVGAIRTLNASVAVAVVLYELLRRRKKRVDKPGPSL
jgi:23S rRNA (guanosine2251-2'-O)-methyltransferase